MGVFLAGLMLPEVQNHSLTVLGDALADAAIPHAIVPFGGWRDIEPVLAQVLAQVLAHRGSDSVFGISVQNTEAALASITLARVLRRRGFQGRIVCGGHFATLNATEILNEVPEVDVVVRLAGEEALARLGRGSCSAAELAQLPGVVFRDGEGAPRFGAPGRAVRPVPLARRRAGLPTHLGFSAVDLVSSTGCEANCSYCCIAATTRLTAREAARDVARPGAPSIVGVVPGRADRLVDEIAGLFHGAGARVFTVMDDNLLPQAADDAEELLAAVARGLRANGVGRIALSLQLRADVVTPAVADALVAVGVVRAYVGIDGFSRPQLARLGRSAPASAGARAIALLTERGVFAVCNSLLVGPTIPLESIRAELVAMRALRGAPLHLLPIDVRAGTTYHARAARRGLLEGGFLWRRYRFEDPRTAVLAAIITGFPTRLEQHSVPLALYDLAYNLGIANRLLPGVDVAREAETYTRVSDAWNADQLRILEGALSVAAGGNLDAARGFVAAEQPRVLRIDRALLEETRDALVSVERAVRAFGNREARVHLRGQLLSAVAFSMALAGCSQPPSGPPGDKDAGVDVSAPTDARSFVADLGPRAGSPDALRDVATCSLGTLPVDAGFYFDPVPCFGSCSSGARVNARFDELGQIVSIEGVDGGALSADIVACIESTFSGYCYPSLAGTTQVLTGHCWIA